MKGEFKVKIVCTYDEYDKMEEIFNKMYFKASDYVPTMYDLSERIIPNLSKYVVFLFWIDLTGHDTEENKEIRRMIRKLLTEKVELIESS